MKSSQKPQRKENDEENANDDKYRREKDEKKGK